MKKIFPVALAFLLSACGAGSEQPSAPALLGTMGAQRAEAKNLKAIPGERKLYDISWGKGQLSGVSKYAPLANFQLATAEIRLQDISLSFDKDGGTGQLFRLYQAAFGRVPDVRGFGYWKNAIETNGLTIGQVASAFLDSVESKSIFGQNSDDATFVDRLYLNVLKRKADAAGADYWAGAMKSGTQRVDVLLAFTDSTENKTATEATITKGMAFAEPGIQYLPVANAIGPADVAIGMKVEVDGSRSTDANDDSLQYRWTVTSHPSGSIATFIDPNVVKPNIVFDQPGTYELTLVVRDATSESYTPAKLSIVAHGLVADSGTFMCTTLDAITAVKLYTNGHTYLDRNKNGIPCDSADAAYEYAPTVTPIVDSGRYKCSSISHETAVLLFLQGHTYLDRDHDGKPCEATDVTVENILYPPIYTPPATTTPTTGKCWVNGYTKKNGTHVNGYWRSC
jgi:hypothetical protein